MVLAEVDAPPRTGVRCAAGSAGEPALASRALRRLRLLSCRTPARGDPALPTTRWFCSALLGRRFADAREERRDIRDVDARQLPHANARKAFPPSPSLQSKQQAATQASKPEGKGTTTASRALCVVRVADTYTQRCRSSPRTNEPLTLDAHTHAHPPTHTDTHTHTQPSPTLT